MLNVGKYISRLNLVLLKDNGEHYSMQCPFCGKSDNNPNGRPAYVLGVHKDKPHFFCHRCLKACSFVQMLKELDHDSFYEATMELRNEKLNIFAMKTPPSKTVNITEVKTNYGVEQIGRHYESISSLPDTHKAKSYLIQRKIPEEHFTGLYYFYGDIYGFYTKVTGSAKYAEKHATHEGILVPFQNRQGDLVGLCLRTFKGDLRYINLLEDGKRFFLGEHNSSTNGDIYVVEGVFDKLSMSSQNFLAMLSTNTKFDYLREIAQGDITYIFDNEYMNEGIERNIEMLTRKDCYVFLWDNSYPLAKDINDLKTKYGLEDKEIIEYINKNKFNGLSLKMEYIKRKEMNLFIF